MIGVMTVHELHSKEDPRVVLSGGIVHPAWETQHVVGYLESKWGL